MERTTRKEVRFSLTRTLTLISLTLSFTLLLSLFYGEDRRPIKPSRKDKCPVCGMFVVKYPDFLAQILFKDGSYVLLDGTKDMFKYYLNLKKYQPSRNPSDVDRVYVTNYYDLTLTDGFSAYYVLGSDIYGPMGRELIPFEKEADAREFMKDHQGKSILRFKEITSEIVKRLD